MKTSLLIKFPIKSLIFKSGSKEKWMVLLKKWSKLYTIKKKKRKLFLVTVKKQLYNKVNILFSAKILSLKIIVKATSSLITVSQTVKLTTLKIKVILPIILSLKTSHSRVSLNIIMNSVNMEVKSVKSNLDVKNSRNKIKSPLVFSLWKISNPYFKMFINLSIIVMNIEAWKTRKKNSVLQNLNSFKSNTTLLTKKQLSKIVKNKKVKWQFILAIKIGILFLTSWLVLEKV